MKTLATLAAHPRVDMVDDERQAGNGIIVTLRQGWSFDPLADNRVRGADSASQALAMVRREALRFAGPYEA